MALADRVAALETEVYALYLAARDPRTPLSAKAVILFTVSYIASPIDPIPDFIPVIGVLDELLILMMGVWFSHRRVPDDVLAECRSRVGTIEVGRARWFGVVLAILVWIGLTWVVLRVVLTWV